MKKVQLYAMEGCGHCKTVKDYFAKKRIPYKEIIVNKVSDKTRIEAENELKDKGVRTGAYPIVRITDNKKESFVIGADIPKIEGHLNG